VRLLLLSAVLAAVVAAPADAASAPRSIFQDDDLLLRSGDASRERALDELAALGVDAIRVLVVWRAHDLGALDALAAGAERRGMHLLMTPTGPGPRGSRFDVRGFGRFVATLGARYSRQRHWAIWNEPNNPRWLQPQFSRGRPRSPALYRRLVRAAVAALRDTGHRGDEILIGETAPIGRVRGRGATDPMMPGPFLRSLLCCGRLGATGLSHHAYTRGGSMPPRFPALPGELSIAALPELVHLARGLPVHLTEGGWQTTPPDPLFGVHPARQAEYLNEVEWMVRGHRRVRSVPQYLLVDERDSTRFQSGLRFANGRAKPALAAYRLPIWVVRRGRSVTVWARMRAAPRGGPREAAIERRLPGRRWRVVRTVRAGEDVVGRIRSARAQWRVRWNGRVSRTAAEARR
jgi:hypothetical protein